jgi:putative flippase GtrA
MLGYCIYVLAIMLGYNFIAALILDYIVVGILSFVINKFWVFQSSGRLGYEFIKFILTIISIFLLNLLVLSALLQFSLLGPYSAQLLAIVIVTLSSYMMQKFWVFGK